MGQIIYFLGQQRKTHNNNILHFTQYMCTQICQGICETQYFS